MISKYMTGAIASLALGTLAAGSAFAQDTVKIGLIVAMTGQQASTGKEIKAAVDLYMKEHGDTVASAEPKGFCFTCNRSLTSEMISSVSTPAGWPRPKTYRKK